MNKASIASSYYNELVKLEEYKDKIGKTLAEKTKALGKENFINEYPLSTLGIINCRNFWELCKELRIVEKPIYYAYEDFNDFEKELYDILRTVMSNAITYEDAKSKISKLFIKHNIDLANQRDRRAWM